MSNIESDSELTALRNELLISLLEKQSKSSIKVEDKSSTSLNKPTDDENDNEESLEQLRINALNAKRSSNKTIKKYMPARFRYEKENSNEEDDFDFEFKNYSNSNYDEFDGDDESIKNDNNYSSSTNNNDKDIIIKNDSQINKNTIENSNDHQNQQTTSIKTNYRNNYETYMIECSKIMQNDEYEPNPINDSFSDSSFQLSNSFDLRDFLRGKAQIKKQQQEENDSKSEWINIQDIDYYTKPITQPINVSRDEICLNNNYHAKNFSRNLNQCESGLINRKFTNLNKEKVTKYDQQRFYSNNNNRKSEQTKDHQTESSSDTDTDSDLERNSKKLKSIVTVPVTSKNK